jgi:hypothetical protein
MAEDEQAASGEEKRERSETASRRPQTGSSIPVDDNERLEQPAGLLEQFYSTLQVTYLAALQESLSSDNAVCKMIATLLKEKPSWRAAYQIEQLLSLVLTEAQLETELKRRMAEATELKLPYTSMLKELSEKITDDQEKARTEKKRSILHRLINDLQWFYSQRFQRRVAAETLAYRVSQLFLYTFVVFFIVLFMQLFGHPFSERKVDTSDKDGNKIGIPAKQPESNS